MSTPRNGERLLRDDKLYARTHDGFKAQIPTDTKRTNNHRFPSYCSYQHELFNSWVVRYHLQILVIQPSGRLNRSY